MAYRERKGNLFDSDAQTLVNTVNCVGVMGKGVALEFQRRFPEMFEQYRSICDRGELKPGHILPYRNSNPWVLNFAVKADWKQPSRFEWVESCLQRFQRCYREMGITSIAFPWIGAMNGGLPWNRVHDLMREYLVPLDDIKIEVVEFDPAAPDALYHRIETTVRNSTPEMFADHVGIRRRAAQVVFSAVESGAKSMTQLCAFPRVGEKTIERLYASFRSDASECQSPQISEQYLFKM